MDLESEYNNRQRVPDYAEIAQRWAAASAEVRAELDADLDIAYGPHERHRFDLFHPSATSTAGAAEAPLAVFIHGGYWQRGDRKDVAFVAQELAQRGVRVALPSYRLCPEVRVADTVADLRACLLAIWVRTGRRPVVVGHSAGGHLAAALLATDWSGSPTSGAPADLVRCAYAISGVFDLPPLITTSLNDALKLDADEARAASPLFWAAPRPGSRMVAAVGGAESQEFLRQSLDLTAAWSAHGVTAECVVVPGANHFTVVDEMAVAHSAMVERIADLAAKA